MPASSPGVPVAELASGALGCLGCLDCRYDCVGHGQSRWSFPVLPMRCHWATSGPRARQTAKPATGQLLTSDNCKYLTAIKSPKNQMAIRVAGIKPAETSTYGPSRKPECRSRGSSQRPIALSTQSAVAAERDMPNERCSGRETLEHADHFRWVTAMSTTSYANASGDALPARRLADRSASAQALPSGSTARDRWPLTAAGWGGSSLQRRHHRTTQPSSANRHGKHEETRSD